MRRTRHALAIATAAFALLTIPSAADAACSGGSGVTYNRSGERAVFKQVTPQRGMNCASARYVVDRWLRPAFGRSYGHALPTRFYDGYVTWHCGRTTATRWRCREYTTNTAFGFTAYRY